MRKDGEQVFGVGAGGPVGDLAAELVALAELLPDDADDVVGVAVVLGEDDRLGHDGAVREYLREELVPERPYDGANLVFGDDFAVELVGGVDQVVLELLLSDRPSPPVAPVDVVFGVHGRSLLGDPGADPVGIEVDVHAVDHGLFVVVLRDHVLLEEAEGLLGGGRGQPYEEGVEVVEHLPPQVVDGAVALVGDDDVEGVDGDVGVVHDGHGLSAKRGRVEAGDLLLVRVQLFALEDGVDALDGGDADAADRVDARGL